MSVCKFQVSKRPGKYFGWTYFSKDGKVIAHGKPADRKDKCYEEIREIKTICQDPSLYKKITHSTGEKMQVVGKSFKLKSRSHDVLMESEIFKTDEECGKAIFEACMAYKAAVIEPKK